MKYYKGFKEDLTCLRYQFEVGKEFEVDTSKRKINLCSWGFHFCSTLGETFNYYSNNGKHKYGIIEILEGAEVLKGSDKHCANKIKIIKILSEEEIKSILAEEEKEYKDTKVYCLDVVRELQSKYRFMIGGSVSLYLQGYDLNRERNKIDFDIIAPYYEKFIAEDFDIIEEIEEFDGKSSGNDYSNTFALTTKDGRFLKLDVRIAPEKSYNIVKYKGHSYKVCDLMTTLEAKCRYAMEGNKKHEKDILSLMVKNNIDESNVVKETPKEKDFFDKLNLKKKNDNKRTTIRNY